MFVCNNTLITIKYNKINLMKTNSSPMKFHFNLLNFTLFHGIPLINLSEFHFLLIGDGMKSIKFLSEYFVRVDLLIFFSKKISTVKISKNFFWKESKHHLRHLDTLKRHVVSCNLTKAIVCKYL
jgi:hypothetical protein